MFKRFIKKLFKVGYEPTDRPSKQMEEICRQIGEYIFNACGQDREKASDVIHSLGITEMKVSEGSLTIWTSRPGFMIGKRGERIDGISQATGLKVRIIEVQWTFCDLMLWGIPSEYPEDGMDEWFDHLESYRDDVTEDLGSCYNEQDEMLNANGEGYNFDPNRGK